MTHAARQLDNGRGAPERPRLQRPELETLLASLAWPRTAAARDRLRAGALNVTDWTHVLRLAERHRVAGLVAFALEEADVQLPSRVRADLARRRLEVACEELGIVAELHRLKAAFAKAACGFALLKGLAAAVQGFDHVGLRQNRDIDLLIEAGDLPRAVQALTGLGYVQVEPEEPLTQAALQTWAGLHKDIVFRKGDAGIVVEVHWRLFDNARFAAKLGRLETTALVLPGELAVPSLTVASAFAYMAAHGAQHAWSRLKWLADFAAYVSALGERRTAELYDDLAARGLGGPVGQGLILSHELIGTPLPPRLVRERRSSLRLNLLCAIGRSAIGGPRAIELEDRAFGSTLKTLSHYLLSGSAPYLLAQALLDMRELPKSEDAGWVRRLGLLAKPVLWVLVRLRRARTRRATRQG